jgi:hypothetical protein
MRSCHFVRIDAAVCLGEQHEWEVEAEACRARPLRDEGTVLDVVEAHVAVRAAVVRHGGYTRRRAGALGDACWAAGRVPAVGEDHAVRTPTPRHELALVGATPIVVDVGVLEICRRDAEDQPQPRGGEPLLGRLDLRQAHLLHLVEHEPVEGQALGRHQAAHVSEVGD